MSPVKISPLLPAVAIVTGLLVPATPARAQVEAEPVLEGRVRLVAGPDSAARPDETPTGIESEWVVLHRVAADTAGAMDSITAAPDGSFAFRLPTVPDPGGRGDIYFASVEHQGIMYFGEPVTTAVQLDSLYLIEVYDTTAVPAGGVDLPLAVRYLVLEDATASEGTPGDGAEGWRVTDLLQLFNPGDRTLVPVEDGPIWSYPLPDRARSVQIGAGDVGPDATRVEDGRLWLYAPLPPGQRQLIVRYTLESPEVTFSMPGRTEAAELLIREPAPPLTVEGLERGEQVEMGSGITYRRYAGSALSDATVRVTPGGEEDGGIGLPPRWIAVILALLLGVVGVWAAMRRSPGGPVALPGGAAAPEPDVEPRTHAGTDPDAGQDRPPEALSGDERNRLLLEVARIDESLEAEGLDPDEAVELRRRRAELVVRLRGAG